MCVCVLHAMLTTDMYENTTQKIQNPTNISIVSKFIWQRTGHFKFGEKKWQMDWSDKKTKITWQTVKETETKQIIKYIYMYNQATSIHTQCTATIQPKPDLGMK